MRRNPTTVVVLFVRLPVPGRVKTRLAAGLGAEGACHLYRAMVADILDALGNCGLPIHLLYDEGDDWAVPQAWRDAAARVQRQRGGDIGERMAAACADCFAAGSDQAILIGSDIPDLDSETIQAAQAALATQDAALAPAVDGGYGLIALKRARFRPEVFAAIPWSTGDVLRVTLQRFAAFGLRVGLLPELRDIDTLDDLRTYWRSPHPASAHTNRTIAGLLGAAAPGGRGSDGSFFREFP